ncbi:MAG: hypothetical protein IKR76_05055 [Ruminococcus sp.]|nr:hypothetical protein [Ruminococcus sp.]
MDNNFNPSGGQWGQPQDNGYLGTPGQGYNQPYGSGGQWNDRGGYYPGSQQGGYYPGRGQQGGFYPGSQPQGGYNPGGQPQGGYYQGGQPQRGFTPNPGAYNPYAQSGYYNRNTGYGSGGGFAVRNLPIIPDAPINYMIFLPLFGLFLENFAASLPLGILLWGLVMIFLRVAAYRDAKRAIEKNILQSSATTVAVLAPIVYLFMRCQGLGKGMGRFIALCITAAIALFTNGFTQSMRTNTQSFIEIARSRYLSELSVVEKVEKVDENYMLDDRVKIFIDEPDWSYSEFGGKKCVILKGTFNDLAPEDYKGKETELKLKSNFDGYNIKSMSFKFDECTLDGKEVTGKDKEKLIKGLTHDWASPKGDNSTGDSSGSE